jgi:uncharacterized protein (TIGR00299 family) protein
MRTAWLDCSSGISGDMLLGALADAGASGADLCAVPARLGLNNVTVRLERVERGHLAAIKAHVEVAPSHHHHHRSLSAIVKMIEASGLPPRTRDMAIRVFRRLGEAEAEVHAAPIERVHFHEVGAEDSITDICGACAGLELLGIERLVCSPLDVGGGFVDTAHGRLPVPAPATARLLAGAPVYSSGVAAELVTPTGAAFVATLAESFGPLPRITLERTGYGAGTRELSDRPNTLRILVGEAEAADKDGPPEIITVLEANLDDLNPQIAGYVADKALDSGALDCYFTPVQMKKGRPGLLVTVLCAPGDGERMRRLLFAETSTLGVRSYRAERRVLQRRHETIETEFGAVRVKVASQNGEILNFAPEYEDCRRLAEEKQVPLKRVMEQAAARYLAARTTK